MPTWDDPQNAKLYDEFARRYPLYRETSRDLVSLAEVEDASLVVDLACGTGVTTEAILDRAGPGASAIALDRSEAMLAVARSRVTDPRVRWVCAPAVELARHAGEADAVICNSAVWQLDMEPTMAAVAQALRPGGRFVFNIGRQFLMLPLTPAELHPEKPTLFHLIQALAVLEHGYAPPHPVARRGLMLTPDGVTEMIRRAGLAPDEPVAFEYDDPPDAALAWLKIPVFADNVLPGMDYETQRAVLDKAYERLDESGGDKSRWMVFVARKAQPS